jgi:hypothetical protein
MLMYGYVFAQVYSQVHPDLTDRSTHLILLDILSVVRLDLDSYKIPDHFLPPNGLSRSCVEDTLGAVKGGRPEQLHNGFRYPAQRPIQQYPLARMDPLAFLKHL